MQALQVSKLQAHPQNEYFFDEMSGQKWEEFKESIKTSGVIEPIVVTQDLIIVSGHQRVRACRELGIVTILGEVRHYDNHDGRCAEDWVIKDLIETNVRQRGNIGGSELKAVHRVDELRRIYKVDGGGKHKSCDNVTTSGEPVTAEEACKAAGIDYASYRQFKSLSDLIPDWQELLESGNVSASVAARIVSKLSEDDQEELYNALPVKERITGKVAERYLRQIRQQQHEAEEKEKQLQGLNAQLSNRLNQIVAKNNELDDRITELKQKGNPELVEKMDKLQMDYRRTYENYQKVNSENFQLKAKLNEAKAKQDEANAYIQELMAEKDALEDGVAMPDGYEENMRELYSLRAEKERLEKILEERDKHPLVKKVDSPYTMGTLKKFLSEAKSELETYVTSEALSIDAEVGDKDYIRELIGELVPLALRIKDKVKEVAA
ncbi:MAG: ParB N-terminal domain-containing protein [Eubacteriales bacterium]|nr:ParB N-terminal domain-containing protein [Eubacteriales bacterium]